MHALHASCNTHPGNTRQGNAHKQVIASVCNCAPAQNCGHTPRVTAPKPRCALMKYSTWKRMDEEEQPRLFSFCVPVGLRAPGGSHYTLPAAGPICL
eukprot:1158842-Pelagomonas_calceolata.AAC.8